MNKNSIWKEYLNDENYKSIKEDIKTNVLIIGGGITGILCAYELKQRNIDYILVEKDKVGNGTTKDTTAFITVQHETLYHQLIEKKGIKKAKEYLNLNLEALKKYKDLSKKYDFDFKETSSTIYSKVSSEIIKKEKEALDKLDYPSVLVDNVPLEKNIKLGIRFDNQAVINPIKLINKLLKELNIYENTEVLKLINNKAILKNDKTIKFNKVIIATNYPIKNIMGLYFMKLTQRRSYVAAIKGNAFDGTFCNIDEEGLYFRCYNDYIIIGGNDRDTKEKNIKDISYYLEKILKTKNIEFMWSGQDCISLDGVPYIGRFSKLYKDYYIATGFNLWGFTWAMASSFILADIIEGKEENKLVSPSRNVYNKNLILNIKNSITNLVNFKTPRCSHMGCALKYNIIDNVWECPCHGSRFKNDGSLIKGPAQKKINITKKM